MYVLTFLFLMLLIRFINNANQEIDESLLNLYIPLSFFPCTPTYIIMIYHQIMSVTPWECLE